MEEYYFAILELKEVWQQTMVSVEANSYQEALEKCMYRDYEIVLDVKNLDKTESAAPQYCGNRATIEIIDPDTNLKIFDNLDGFAQYLNVYEI